MSAYTGPIGKGSTFRRGDRTIRIVGDFCPTEGWPYLLTHIGEREISSGRKRIADHRLRREFEPIEAVV